MPDPTAGILENMPGGLDRPISERAGYFMTAHPMCWAGRKEILERGKMVEKKGKSLSDLVKPKLANKQRRKGKKQK